MQDLTKKTKAELISIINSSNEENSGAFERGNTFTSRMNSPKNDKYEILLKLIDELSNAACFEDLKKIISENFKRFWKPGNWGVKLGIYDISNDKYRIIFPEGQPCVCAPVLTECKYEEIGYYSKLALDTKKILLINDNHSEESLKIDSRQIALSRGAMIFIPLYNKDIPVGLFSYSTSPEYSLDTDFLSFLESAAKLFMLAITRILSSNNQIADKPSIDDRRYKRLLDVITDYHYHVVIENGKPIRTIHNISSISVTGYNPEEFERDNFLWFKMIYEDDRKKVQTFINKIFTELASDSIEHRMIRKDGELIWVKNTIIPEKDENGNMIGYDGLLQDITEKKKAEEKISYSEEKLNKVFDQSPDLLIIISYDHGIILDINKTALRFFEKEKHDVLNKSIANLGFVNLEIFESIKNEINANGIFKKYNFQYAKNKDEDYLIDLGAELLETSAGKSILIVAEDRTKQARMQSELERIHNLESIGILAGGIAHDFNNVLTAILGNISFIKMNVDSGDRMYKFLARAEDSCFKAKELSNKLLTFSKGGKPKRELVSIEKLVQDYTLLSLSGSNIFMNFQSRDSIEHISIDEEQIRQVVTSIVENAKEAMPYGGELVVRIENETVLNKTNLPLEKGEYIKISFIDHGLGIPPENITKVFDPYFSTKIRGSEKGMGLGLSISYSIISKHNGCIIVSSQVGFGSTFTVYLPSVRD